MDEKVTTDLSKEMNHLTVNTAKESSEIHVTPRQFKSPKNAQMTENMRKLDRIYADKSVLKKDEDDNQVFCLRFSPDSKFIAAGCGDGSVRVFNSDGKMAYMLNAASKDALPATVIRFRPSESTSRSKNMLIIGSANGTIEHWHMTSRKRIFKIEEKDNQVYALDYCSNGDMFASAGKDTVVRVYEEGTKSLLCKFERGFCNTHVPTGHSNRVYGLKFHPKEKNMLVSAGWDNTVQIWDIRTKKPVRYIYGPHVCGDSLDIEGNTLMTGSWKSSEALQLWDLGTAKLIETIPFRPKPKEDKTVIPEMLYAAAFSPSGKMIAAGGSGGPDVRVFKRKADKGPRRVDNFSMSGAGVYSLHFSPNGRKLAAACGNAQIAVMDMVDTEE